MAALLAATPVRRTFRLVQLSVLIVLAVREIFRCGGGSGSINAFDNMAFTAIAS
jgi:hypothetical protein